MFFQPPWMAKGRIANNEEDIGEEEMNFEQMKIKDLEDMMNKGTKEQQEITRKRKRKKSKKKKKKRKKRRKSPLEEEEVEDKKESGIVVSAIDDFMADEKKNDSVDNMVDDDIVEEKKGEEEKKEEKSELLKRLEKICDVGGMVDCSNKNVAINGILKEFKERKMRKRKQMVIFVKRSINATKFGRLCKKQGLSFEFAGHHGIIRKDSILNIESFIRGTISHFVHIFFILFLIFIIVCR